MISDVATGILRERHGVSGPVTTHETWNGSTVIEIDELIMKVNDHPSAAAEQRVVDRVRSAGVPAPEIIDTGTDSRFPGRRWIIMRRVPGTSWDASAADDAEVGTVLADVAQLLLIMRELTCPGYGWIDPDGNGRSADWWKWLQDQITDRTHQLGGRLPPGFGPAATETIDRIAATPVNGSILHGDLGLSHVFVDPHTHRVIGLIDWSNAVIGDPLYDLATFAMGGPAGDPIQQRLQPRLQQIYTDQLGPGAVDERRLGLYRMLHHLNNACWSVENHVDDWTVDLCTAAADQLHALQF